MHRGERDIFQVDAASLARRRFIEIPLIGPAAATHVEDRANLVLLNQSFERFAGGLSAAIELARNDFVEIADEHDSAEFPQGPSEERDRAEANQPIPPAASRVDWRRRGGGVRAGGWLHGASLLDRCSRPMRDAVSCQICREVTRPILMGR